MAAVSDAPLVDLIELQHLTGNDLNPLLNEEIVAWDRRFSWDFRASADLLRRFLQIHSLSGYGLRYGRDIVGYAYFVCEGRKGLIGDFYVRAEYATSLNEKVLLRGVVQAMMATPGIRRIESQVMLLQAPLTHPAPFGQHMTRHDRYFMEVSSETALKISARTPSLRVNFLPWAERWQEEIAHLVSASYRGHVDSEINDQYRSIPGARHFLNNIVRFPGCGRFCPEASLLAVDERTGRVCGVCLTSMVSRNSGHVTQICTLPAIRGAGVGFELLRSALIKLARLDCNSVSLTVTCSNRDAIRLYESAGFRQLSTFPALVWEGF